MGTFAVGDIHGHREALRELLRQRGLVDARGAWEGGTSTLWLLGDYVDRGPDGIGVVDDVRSWIDQAKESGGAVHALLGNHELQLLAAHRFRDKPVPELGRYLNWLNGWRAFGGRNEDLERLTPDHVDWLATLPAMGLANGHLLVHSDTASYLELGRDINEVNTAVGTILTGDDMRAWLTLGDQLAARDGFREKGGVNSMLARFGGNRIVHGHSTLISYFGHAPGDVHAPYSYSDGRVLAIDGGVYEGGRLLLVELG